MNTIRSAADVIGSAVASLDSSIRDAKARRAALKSGKSRAMLEKLLTPLLYILGDLGSIRIDSYRTSPSIYITMFDLDSLKQRELVTILAYLQDETDKLNGKTTSEDWAIAVNRDFKFATDKWEVSVSAYVKDDSPTCRRVVVGTKMVEQVQYEIACD
jgi:hypothetical protein